MLSRRLQELDVELILGLHHLRYLTMVQIRSLWAPERSHEAVRKWIGRLEAVGLLRSMRTNDIDTRVVQLALAGYRALSEHRDGVFRPTRALGPHFLPHHLAVNDVFAALIRQTPVVWSALPWRWLTRTCLSWRERRLDEFGVVQSRRAVLWPDAVVEVPCTSRVFVELDRSTECLRESDERRSIRRKIKGYASALLDAAHQKSGDAQHDHTFVDDIVPKLLFILTRHDRRQGDRRQQSILRAASDIDVRLSVQCLYSDEIEAIRNSCGLDTAAEKSSGAPNASLALTVAEAGDLQRLYRLAVSLAPRTADNIDVTQAARRALMRLHRAAQT
jgi:hypothetical protein